MLFYGTWDILRMSLKSNYLLSWVASLVTAYAALRPRDGFSHPHQEHMKDTYNKYNKILWTDKYFLI